MSFLSNLRGEVFERGIHPPQNKLTADQTIRRLPFAPRLIVPLSQHIGQPAKAVVRVGKEAVSYTHLCNMDIATLMML